MVRVRVHNFFLSLDGVAAGMRITVDQPIGGAERLHAGFDGRVIHGIDGAPDAPLGLDRAMTSTWAEGIGVEIMGRRKFGPVEGPWPEPDDWRGWWGDDPPFRTPVIVLTHYPREPLEVGTTTFHFVDASPAEALELAAQLAPGLDVRLGGGPSSIREFLAADLVDEMHLVIRPIVLGEGVRLWDGLSGIDERFDIATAASPSGNIHQFWHRRRS